MSSGIPCRAMIDSAYLSSSSIWSPYDASHGASASSAQTSAPERSARICTSPMWSMCWWVTTIRSRSATLRPCSPSAASSVVSDVPLFGPLSTSVSGSSSIRYVLTRPTANGVGIGRQWMPAAVGAVSAIVRRTLGSRGVFHVERLYPAQRGEPPPPRGLGEVCDVVEPPHDPALARDDELGDRGVVDAHERERARRGRGGQRLADRAAVCDDDDRLVGMGAGDPFDPRADPRLELRRGLGA